MYFLVELTGEHPSLPLEELKAAARSAGEQFTLIHQYGRVALVESDGILQSVSRCSLVRSFSLSCTVDVLLEGSSFQKIGNSIRSVIEAHFLSSRSFRITLRKIGGRHPQIDIEKIINEIASQLDLEVALDSPDLEILVFITPMLFVGIKIYENIRTGFRERAVRYRPFFSPVSLPPVFARTLVNLCRVHAGGIILDPFCGTGGVIIEASMLGYRTIGSDRDMEMLKGTRINLEHFKLSSELIHSDVGDLEGKLSDHGIEYVDGIATDMPYGRASTTFGEDSRTLTSRSLKVFDKILIPGGFAALVVPDIRYIKMNIGKLKLVSCFRSKVHRSLTRYYVLLHKRE